MRAAKLSDLTEVPALLGTAFSVEGAIHGKNELSSKVEGVEYTGQFTAKTGDPGKALYLTKHIKNIRILKR